jgi:hypothetical protein
LQNVVLLASAICAVGGELVLAQDTQGQPPQKLFGDVRDCPPGHRIEFVLPAGTLYIDPHWLGSVTIINLKEKGGPACPTGPIKRSGIELGYGVLRALDVHHGIGTRLMRFDVGSGPNDPQSLTATRSPSEPKRSAPWIEDDTVLKNVPDSRGYLLYYPDVEGVPNRPVRIGCGGGGIIPGTQQRMPRTCRKDSLAGKNTPFAGFHYSYILSQTEVPIPDLAPEYSTDPESEPGALFEFDSHFRAWLLSVAKRP